VQVYTITILKKSWNTFYQKSGNLLH